MKKTLLIVAVAGLALASCKKDRTCTCTSTVVSSTSTDPNYSYTAQPPTTTTTTYTKIKKSNVLASTCVSSKETRTYNDVEYTGPTSQPTNYVVTEVTQNTCDLK